ncbi:MAG: hypothetical protein FWB99_00580 [Treponema sp.]|nr:hypothetical protein [Treponema sp.]
MTITQTVEIPADRRLIIEVPSEVPAGRAQVELKVIPFPRKMENPQAPLKILDGASTPIADSLLGAASNLGEITLEEIREERLSKYFS